MSEDELIRLDQSRPQAYAAETNQASNIPDSSFWEKSKNTFSKSSIGQLVGFGSPDDRKSATYGTSKGSWGGFLDAPRTLNYEGNTFNTNNRNFNEMEQNELNAYEQENFKPSGNPKDRFLYKMKHKQTGAVKYGTAKNGIYERYSDDPTFGDWDVIYNERTANADKIEHTIHGAKASRDNQAFRYGSSTDSALQYGGSEIYNPHSDNVKNLKKASSNILAQLTGGTDKSEDALEASPQFYEKAKRYLEATGENLKGLTPREVNQKMTSTLSGYNWNLPKLMHKTYGLSNLPQDIVNDFVDMRDAYDETDTDIWQVGRGLKELIQDPTTYAAIPTGGTGTIAKIAIMQGVKAGVKQLIKRKAVVGAIEGAAYGAADDALKQTGDILAKKQDSLDWSRLGTSATLGAGLGGGLNAGLTKLLGADKEVNRLISKKAQELSGIKNKETRLSPFTAIKPNKPEPVIAEAVTYKDTGKPVDEAEVQVALDSLRSKDSKLSLTEQEQLDKKVRNAANRGNENALKYYEEVKEQGKPLTGQESVATIKQRGELAGTEFKEGKQRASTDAIRSIHSEKSNVATYSLEDVNPRTFKLGKDNSVDFVNRSTEAFRAEQQNLHKYGKTDAKFKDVGRKTSSERALEQANFQSKKFSEIKTEIIKRIDSGKLTPKEHKLATKEISIINARLKRIKQVSREKQLVQPTLIEREKADIEYSRQYSDKSMDSIEIKTYEKESLLNESIYTQKKRVVDGKWENWLDGFDTTKDGKLTSTGQKKFIQNVNDSQNLVEFSRANDRIDVKMKLTGSNKMTDKFKRANKEDLMTIEHHLQTKFNLEQLKAGKITNEQFRHRIKLQLDEIGDNQLMKKYGEKDSEISDLDSVKLALSTRRKLYESFGIKVKEPEAVLNKQSKSTGLPESEQAKLNRLKKEEKEITSAQSVRDYSENELNEYATAMKIDSDHIQNQPRYKTGDKAGKPKYSKAMLSNWLDDSIDNEFILDSYSPAVAKKNKVEAKKKAKELVTTSKNFYDKPKDEAGQNLKWTVTPNKIKFNANFFDAKNSMIQMMGALLGNKKIFNSFGTIREEIGAEMSNHIILKELKGLTKEKQEQQWKKLVKPIFMTKNYGQGDKGLINNLIKDNNWSRLKATKFLKAYKMAETKLFPELAGFAAAIEKKIKRGTLKELTWTLPDGTIQTIDLRKIAKGEYSFKGSSTNFNARIDSADEFTSAVLPLIVQSMDGYIIKRLKKANALLDIHDNMGVAKGVSIEDVTKAYNKALTDLNNSNILDQVKKQMKLSSTTQRDLLDEDILNAKTLGMEHTVNEYEILKSRKPEMGTEMEKEDLMFEFIIKNDHRAQSMNQIIDFMVNESSMIPRSQKKVRQSPLERLTAMAHQSDSFKRLNFIMKPPKDMSIKDKKLYWKTLENKFNELRAKLEYNPFTSEILTGNRKFFNKDGSIVGGTNRFKKKQSYNSILTQITKDALERDKASRDYLKNINMPKEFKQKARYNLTNYSNDAKMGYREGEAKKWLIEQTKAKPQVANPEQEEILKEVKSSGYTTNYMSEMYSKTKTRDDFDELTNLKRNAGNQVFFNAETMQKKLDGMFEKETDQKHWYNMVFKTNMHGILGYTQESANKKMNEILGSLNVDTYALDEMTNAAARSYGDNSLKYGAYMNNGRTIARELDIDIKDFSEAMDFISTVKAMNNKKGAWDFMAEQQGTEVFKLSMDILTQTRKLSKQSFEKEGNPESFITGYVTESFDGFKRIENQEIKYNAEQIKDQGALISKDQDAIMGQLTEASAGHSSERQNFEVNGKIDRNAMFKHAEDNNYKIMDKGFGRVQQTGKLRDEAGRQADFSKALIDTMASVQHKWANLSAAENQIKEIIKESSSLFSNEAKTGFKAITKEQDNNLVPSLRGTIKFYDQNYEQRLFGRDEVRLWNKNKDTEGADQTMKIADRLLKDFFLNAKQNIVLKNISSFKNAFLGGISLNLMTGANPKQLYKFYREVGPQAKQIEQLISKRAYYKSIGQSTKTVDAKLSNIPLFQMEQAGLSVNQLDGVRGKSSFISHFVSDQTGGRLDDMLGTNFIQKGMDATANVLLLNQKTKLGKTTTSLFSGIDTQSRYAAAKAFMENDKMSMKDAVFKANGMYGDMSQMAPAWVEAIDKYGGVLFAQWAMNVIPGISRLAKDNWKKTMTLTVGIYGISVATDTNLDSVNPVATMVDFAVQSPEPSLAFAMNDYGIADAGYRRLTSFLIPGMVRDVDKLTTDIGDYTAFSGEKTRKTNVLFKDRLEKPNNPNKTNYQGAVTRVVEGIMN